MDIQQIQQFNIIGIAVRTSNENGQSGTDIPALWQQFMNEGLAEKIPNKIDPSIYCIYTDYEKDHTRPYTTLLGCKVAHLDQIPEGMVGHTFETANYKKIVAKGNIHEGLVYNEWLKIWEAGLPRTFIADFEIYGKKAQDPANAEVDIFIGIA